jgi:chromosome segregation protein
MRSVRFRGVFLRSLTLKGFKSFAEATPLELEPGLTAVVGPNGSGKSNIVDAVAWVLGAQGPRTVRSSRMEDVIFAGNGRRAALGRAEVSLTIDNSAGLLPIGFTEVTLTRTLFRSSGESEYSINGVPCRLLDLQELLSDTGVGRQQHVIVSQGNLDQVLDVRPEDRRLIIEEAAGILKFRRRKEKAERRLEATESHLVRLTDLLKELRRQMRPLERQAEAARRHDELAAELRSVRLYVAGRSLASLRARVEAGVRAAADLAASEARVASEVRALDGHVEALEVRLQSFDGGGLDAVAARLDALRERARGVAAVLAERARSLAAEVAAGEAADMAGDGGGGAADPVARLEAEAAMLTADLVGADEEAGRLAASLATVEEAERELGERRRRLAIREQAEQAARRAAESRGEMAAVQAALRRARAEAAAVETQAASLDAAAEEIAAGLVDAQAELDGATRSEAGAAAQAQTAADELTAAEAALADAGLAVQAAERSRAAAAARVDALGLAAGHTGAPPGAQVPTLLELLEIDEGWEAAVEAAMGEALTALVAPEIDLARAVLEGGGSVVVLPPPGEPPAARPDLRVHVRGPRLDRLLDLLLARARVVEGGWEAGLDAALADPDGVFVTRAGDRFAPTGWRLAGGGASVAAALAEARRRVDEAAEAGRQAEEAKVAAEAAAARARSVHARRADVLAELRAAVAERRALLGRLEADLREAQAAASTGRAHLAATARRVADDERRAATLDQQLSLPLEAGATAVAGFAGDVDTEREDVAWEGQALAARRAQLVAQADALAARRADLARRLSGSEARIEEARAARTQTLARIAKGRVELRHVRRLAEAVAGVAAGIDEHRADVETRRRARAEATRAVAARLDDTRRRRADAEHRLEEVRAQLRRAELEAAETRMRLEAAVESLRRELDCEADTALAAECPTLPAGTSPTTRVRELERELRLVGPVNPLAVEELAALQERDAFLSGQLEDVKTTRRDLSRIIRSVEAEMTGLLAAAYADVAENFTDLFETLFPGGEGRLRLTDPDHILDAGIELEARPGGKSARKLSLLSGGERSLCALAFLFAVFRSRPSPFYLLDEVEAALDDVNLHRFLRLLDEFRSEAQLVVVTHQKRTMEAADCLFGVTLQPGGSSRVLSEKVPVGS